MIKIAAVKSRKQWSVFDSMSYNQIAFLVIELLTVEEGPFADRMENVTFVWREVSSQEEWSVGREFRSLAARGVIPMLLHLWFYFGDLKNRCLPFFLVRKKFPFFRLRLRLRPYTWDPRNFITRSKVTSWRLAAVKAGPVSKHPSSSMRLQVKEWCPTPVPLIQIRRVQ